MSMDFDKMKQSALKSLENPGQGAKPLPKTDKEEPPTLYIFRHCQTFDNVNRIFSGRRQTELTDEGKEQTEELATKLQHKEFHLFVSPPLIRCETTLDPLRTKFPDVEYIKKEDLVERDYGDLTGKSKTEIMEQFPEKAVLWRRSWETAPPNGESLKTVWETRVKAFCEWLEKELKEKKINIAYCGTNNTLRLVRMYFEGLSIEEMLTIEMGYADYASYHIE